MTRPLLLDLFCGAGGAAMGYHKAGFDVVGVDVAPQKNYPFEFIEADALAWVEEQGGGYGLHCGGFVAIHASPPCQAYSTTKTLHDVEYPELLEPVRAMLIDSQLPYIIENVVGAPLHNWVQVCGSSFGLGVRRHRRFESNQLLMGTECFHESQPLPLDVTGTGGPGGRHRKPSSLAQAREAMGIDWMTRSELGEAIPPAYTEWLGKQLIVQLEKVA